MRVLVTYASKHGSTQGIAEAIGTRFRERGLETEVRPIGKVDGLDGYDALVIGSAVYLGSWMKEAVRFLDRHEEALHRVPVWIFSSGPTGTDADNAGPIDSVDTEKFSFLAKQRQRLDALGARDHRVFRGALDPKELNFLERSAIKAAKSELGDFRDWDAVARWADDIADAAIAGPA